MDHSQDSSQDSNPFDEGPTIAPSDLLGSSGVDTTDYSDIDGTVVNAFAMLEFPDSTIPITQSSILLGRDETIRQFESSLEALGVHPSAEGGAVAARPSKNGVVPFEHEEQQRTMQQSVITPAGSNQMFSAEGGTVSGFQSYNSVERKESQSGNEMRIDIHPPIDPETGLRPLGSISKNHLRITFDAEYGWILIVLGRNGVFVNGIYKAKQEAIAQDNEKVILHNGDLITVRGLEFHFWLPTSVESDIESDSAMTSDSEEEEAASKVKLTLKFNRTGNTSDTGKKQQHKRVRSEMSTNESSDEGEEDSDDEGDAETPRAKKMKTKDTSADPADGKSRSSKHKPFNPDDYLRPGETLERRRGPGRPPANGVMSQREMKERKKALAAENGGPETPKPKRKRSDSEQKESEDEEEEVENEKDEAEAKKVKKKVKEESEGKEKKEKKKKGEKRAHAERPPTPDKSTFTEEQLKKPEGTTQDRIYLVLQKSGKPMALQDIYLAIRNEWPAYWYMPSNGWESSVRHTLGQMPIFQQAGKAGKGAYWEINPDVPYTKKTRATHTQQTNNYSRPTPYTQSQTFPQGVQGQYPGGPNAYRPPGPYNGGFAYPNAAQRPMAYPNPGVGAAAGNSAYPQANQANRPPNGPSPYQHPYHAGAYQPPPNSTASGPSQAQTAPHHPPPYPTHSPVPRPPHESNVAQIRAGRMPDLFERFLNTLKTTGDPANRDTLQNKASRAIGWILRNNYPTVQPDDDVKTMVEILWKLACENDRTSKAQQSQQSAQHSMQARQQQQQQPPPQQQQQQQHTVPQSGFNNGQTSGQHQQIPSRTATPGGLPPRPPHSPVTPSQANGLAPPPPAVATASVPVTAQATAPVARPPSAVISAPTTTTEIKNIAPSAENKPPSMPKQTAPGQDPVAVAGPEQADQQGQASGKVQAPRAVPQTSPPAAMASTAIDASATPAKSGQLTVPVVASAAVGQPARSASAETIKAAATTAHEDAKQDVKPEVKQEAKQVDGK